MSPWQRATDLLRWWCTPREMGARKTTVLGLVVLVVLLALASLVRTWLRNQTVTVSVAGFYMTSDASNHFECANGLLDHGILVNPWCERRPVYAALLAGLSALTGRVWFLTLLVQAAIVAMCGLALAREASRRFNLIVAIALFVMFFAYAQLYAFPLSMTENAGLIFGSLGLSLLLAGAAPINARLLAAGAGLLSLGLVARSGPFFMLPAIIAWVFLHDQGGVGRRFRTAGIVCLGAVLGFFVQLLMLLLGDGTLANAQSNFSYTLYGLAVGGRGWTAVVDDHPEIRELMNTAEDAIASRKVYLLALQAFMHDPALLFVGFWRNLSRFFAGPMFTVSWSHYLGFANMCWWLGAIAILVSRRDPRYSLVGWLSIGLVASAAIITIDGGGRVFAAGLAVQALQASLGIAWIVHLAVRAAGTVVPDTPTPYKFGKVESSLAIAMLLIALLPFTPIRQVFAASAENAGCGPGLVPVVARLGFETHYLAIVPVAGPLDVFRMRVSDERLIKRLKDDKSTQEDFAKLPKPITIFRAWPMNKTFPGRAREEVRFFSHGDFSRYMYKTVVACLTRERVIEVAEVPYWRATSITVQAR